MNRGLKKVGNDTRYRILLVALRMFWEKGYSNTSISMIAKELRGTASKGTVTFHFHTKEEILAVLIKELCEFQWELMEQQVAEGQSALVAYLLELATMASVADENAVEKDLYVSAYTNSLSLEIIRKNDTQKAKWVFGEYCPGWTENDYIKAENIVSGIEYAMFMLENTETLTLDERIISSLDTIMKTYGLSEEIRKKKIQIVLDMDYRKLGRRILKEFIKYVSDASEKGLLDVIVEK